ncbi:hypothetical protein N431DRAFT_488401 [Stipitochalara longipes BDJ]|nr:hypothetical protein N431DRAFT_488401 [Stipitochalara longipes BDJ]
MDLEFISFSDPNETRSRDARRRVRSRAMQHVRHRQRLANTNGDSPQTIQPMLLTEHLQRIQPESITWHNSAHKEDEDNAGLNTVHVDISGIQRMEQLEVYPVSQAERYVFTIFLHYGAAVAGSFLPLGKFVPTNPLRTKVLSLVTQDTALYHIILANSGLDMMIWRGEQFFDPMTRSNVRGREIGTVFCTKHKMEAIRIINERLNDPLLSTSDETILAVSHLAGYEMLASTTKKSEDRFTEFEIHMDGIEQMVKLRGGLKRIGLNTCLTHFILRVDHLHSALTGSRPRFSMEDAHEEPPKSPLGPSLAQSPDLTKDVNNSTLLNVLDQLREASQFLENLEDPISEDDFFSFGIKRALIEDDLFKLGNIDTGLPQQNLSPIEQCCRVAALLYVQTSLTKVNCKVYQDLVTALRYGLEQAGLEDLRMEHPNVLLWMLLVGGGAAPFNMDRLWFMGAIEKTLHTSLWEEVEQRLQGWPWRPKYCVPWRAIWREAITMDIQM